MKFKTALLCAFAAILFTVSSAFADSGTLIVLHDFSASPDSTNSDGSYPLSVVLSGGEVYGVSEYSGLYGSGSVFELATNGTGFSDIYEFTGLSPKTYPYVNNDGANPSGLLLSGNTIYGTTLDGGKAGYGSVFSVKTDGTAFTILYNFTNGLDGGLPGPGLVQIGRVLYGTTEEGGSAGEGTLFGVYTNGSGTNGAGFSVLHTFTALDSVALTNLDGAEPVCALTTDGSSLFGTAQYGGAYGSGSVFSLHTDGTGFTTLYSFSELNLGNDENTDGAYPVAGLALTNGVLFGTASQGGTGASGTVFSLNTDGSAFQTLYNFSALSLSTNSDGAVPEGELILSTNAIFGTASAGGADGNGTVFAVSPAGTNFVVLHTFSGGADGGLPNAGLVTDGATLYGTTAAGGAYNSGTVFELVPGGLAPPQIITNLANVSVNVGSPVTLDVFAVGAGALTYQWYFSNSVIKGATSDSYNIKKAAAANNGNYYVVVTGGGGSSTSVVATVSVLIPPVIAGQPVSVSEASGGIASFTVKATGSPLTYQWYYDGAPLSDGNGYSGTSSNKLSIDPVTSQKAGSYYVVVGNGNTTIASKTVTLSLSVEKTKPTVVITSPKASSRTNAPVLSGTASDTVRVVTVAYWITNLNSGIVSSPLAGVATLSAGTTVSNWTIPIASLGLLPGTNVLVVQSTNAAGLSSTAAKVTFFYAAPSVLSLTMNGSGTLTGTASEKGDVVPADQALLNIGEGYTVTAKAGKNWIFQYWTSNGVTFSTNAALKFVMEPNLSLTANFVTNFFVGMAGRYDGIAYPSAQVPAETNSGLIYDLVVGTNGTFSGKLYLGSGTPFALSGAFGAGGSVTKTITRAAKSGGNITLTLNLNVGSSPRTITGSVSSTGWTADNLTLYAAAAPTAIADANNYTMLFSPATNADNVPPDYGYAAATNIAGMMHLGGGLPDGTTFTPLVEPINEANQVPVYASLYANTGFVLGTLNFDASTNGESPTGTLFWFKPPQKTGLYSGGFDTTLTVDGSAWTNSTAAFGALTGDYTLTFSGGGFESDIVDTVSLSTTSTLALVNGSNFSTGTVKSIDGLMNVTYTNALGKKVTASGVVLQNIAGGGGFFTSSASSGTITLQRAQ